jgi:Ca2+-binding RTX toxin-like protein
LLAGGVAWAANITCTGGLCAGTEQDDRITGSQLYDEIQALAGRDVVTARAGDDFVDGGRNRDDISGGPGGDALLGSWGPDDIDGGPSTTSTTINFSCAISDEEAVTYGTQGTQQLWGGNFGFYRAEADGNDDLDGGRDNDLLDGGGGRNDLSGNGGDDCLILEGDANERASGGDGDDIFVVNDGNADDVFCGAGIDSVLADANDRVAADCEHVIRRPLLQATGATPEAEVTITTPDGTIITAP